MVVVCLPSQPGLDLLEAGPLLLPPQLLPKLVLGHFKLLVEDRKLPPHFPQPLGRLAVSLNYGLSQLATSPDSPQTFWQRSKTTTSRTTCRGYGGGGGARQIWQGAQPTDAGLLPSSLPRPHLSSLARQISQLRQTGYEIWRYIVQHIIAQTQPHIRHRRAGMRGHRGVGGLGVLERR